MPSLNTMFWICNVFGWTVLGVGFLIVRQLMTHSSILPGVVFSLSFILFNTLLSACFRMMIHHFKWTHATKAKSWCFIGITALSIGFLVSLLINVASGIFYVIADISTSYVFFWSRVIGLWMLMSLLSFCWAVIYLVGVYTRQLSSLELQEATNALKLKEAQLNRLIGQLNPHFLFNGLNNIRGLMLEDVEKSRLMISKLSNMLRYSLNNTEQELQALASELEVVRCYIALASIQFEERLEYIEKIDETLLSYAVPPMIVQLMVENAIKHGIEMLPDGGTITLDVYLAQDSLRVRVTNPGSLIKPKDYPTSIGIGTENIKQRLEILFGQSATFFQQENKGVITSAITVPLVTHFEQHSLSRKNDILKS